MEERIFKIPEERIEELERKLGNLNRRAIKLGQNLIQIFKSEPIIVEYDMGRCTRTFYDVTLKGLTLKLSDWTFIGTLDYMEAGNIFRALPEKTIPEQYRHVKPACDHCKKQRNRKDTFIVQHNDGTYKQVGRQCLKDFLGHPAPEHIASLCEHLIDFASWSEDDDDYVSSWDRYEMKPSTLYVIALSGAISRRYGWCSKEKANESGVQSTVDIVRDHLNPRWIEKNKEYLTPVAASDLEYAAQVMLWLNEQENSKNEFLRNLFFVTRDKAVAQKHIGLVAASYIAYEKAMSNLKAKAQKPVTGHFGEVGKRAVFTLTITSVQTLEAMDYGQFDKTMIRFKDANGNVAVWFASGLLAGWTVGDEVEVKATVKKHDTYKDVAQTMLSRVALIKIVKEAEPVLCEVCGEPVQRSRLSDRMKLCQRCAEQACNELY